MGTLFVYTPYVYWSTGNGTGMLHQIRNMCSGGSKGGREGCAPPQGSKFFQFHAVFGKTWQIRMLVPPRGVGAPPQGNPGSATDVCDPVQFIVSELSHLIGHFTQLIVGLCCTAETTPTAYCLLFPSKTLQGTVSQDDKNNSVRNIAP